MATLARRKLVLTAGMCWTLAPHNGVKTCASSSFTQFLTSSKGKWKNTEGKKEEGKKRRKSGSPCKLSLIEPYGSENQIQSSSQGFPSMLLSLSSPSTSLLWAIKER